MWPKQQSTILPSITCNIYFLNVWMTFFNRSWWGFFNVWHSTPSPVELLQSARTIFFTVPNNVQIQTLNWFYNTCNNYIMGVITKGLLTGDSAKGGVGCDSNYCSNREEKPQAVWKGIWLLHFLSGSLTWIVGPMGLKESHRRLFPACEMYLTTLCDFDSASGHAHHWRVDKPTNENSLSCPTVERFLRRVGRIQKPENSTIDRENIKSSGDIPFLIWFYAAIRSVTHRPH